MMSFTQWIKTEQGGHVFVFYETADLRAAAHAAYVVEGGRVWELDKRWSVRMDNPHPPNTQPHNHIMFRGDDVSIVNRDGTQSHNTTLDKVPNWVVDRIRQRGLIEGHLLVEAGLELRVTFDMITSVHRRSRWHDFLSTIG
jgi:hypothetical protein